MVLKKLIRRYLYNLLFDTARCSDWYWYLELLLKISKSKYRKSFLELWLKFQNCYKFCVGLYCLSTYLRFYEYKGWRSSSIHVHVINSIVKLLNYDVSIVRSGIKNWISVNPHQQKIFIKSIDHFIIQDTALSRESLVQITRPYEQVCIMLFRV